MRITRRGKFWFVDFRSADGERHRVSTHCTEEAQALIDAGKIVQAAMAAPQVAAGDPRVTLGQALDATYETHWRRFRSAEVMKRTVGLLKRETGSIAVADVTTKSMRATCERWLTEGTAPATVNRRMSAVSMALDRCVEDEIIASKPKVPHYAENNTKERYVSTEEEVAISAELQRRIVSPGDDWDYMRALAIFLMDTGLRFSEAFKFTLVGEHIDLPHGETKNSIGRRVPLTRRAADAAAHLLSADQHKALQAMNSKAAWDWCSYRWDIVTAAAGCPDVTLHILRHTCASRLVQRSVPIYTVSKWLGHSSVKVTERYAKLAPDSLLLARQALEILTVLTSAAV